MLCTAYDLRFRGYTMSPLPSLCLFLSLLLHLMPEASGLPQSYSKQAGLKAPGRSQAPEGTTWTLKPSSLNAWLLASPLSILQQPLLQKGVRRICTVQSCSVTLEVPVAPNIMKCSGVQKVFSINWRDPHGLWWFWVTKIALSSKPSLPLQDVLNILGLWVHCHEGKQAEHWDYCGNRCK